MTCSGGCPYSEKGGPPESTGTFMEGFRRTPVGLCVPRKRVSPRLAGREVEPRSTISIIYLGLSTE